MPTENEVKYVLRNNLATIKWLTENCDETKHITQSYLHDKKTWNLRIRHVISDSRESYELTYKNRKYGRTIEAEDKNLTSADYYDLINDAKLTLSKTRLIFNTSDHQWEVDLFLDEEDIYFIMAEVEMPEGMKAPLSIPDIISPHIIYDAGYSKKFSNTKIADREYAEELYNLLMSGRSIDGK